MRTFNYVALKNQKWDSEIVAYIAAIHEMKGKQDLYIRQKPQELEKLVEIAKVQSTETSNEIEGIRTTNTRLKQLLSEKTTPRTRDEEEIAGYRDVLNVIHESYEYIPVTANYLLQLHKILYSHSGKSIGGKFKNVQNYISGIDANGKEYTIFTPLAPYETPPAIDEICEQFNRAIAEGDVDPLILIPIFIHDFLCIHPFNDGNGRMSRLLTTLLLYRCGYSVGKYISLEAKIAKNKNLYYTSLSDAQIGWHEGNDDPNAFIKYLLGTIISAYRDFEDRMELIAEKLPAIDMVRKAVQSQIGKITKTQICELCPSLSASSVEVVLKKLVANGELIKQGAGRSTFYIRTN
ncbi:MAG: cell filamentation protein Fic [Clostridiales bacterium]|jgi:Fic family protein|nr:MAG: cell filamentation protein Fic [Clostridiales bacterium]